MMKKYRTIEKGVKQILLVLLANFRQVLQGSSRSGQVKTQV